jgi:hypothetical protein
MNNPFIDIGTLVIAIWGAFLSSYLAVREIRKEKRKIEVSCSFSINQPTEKDKLILLIQVFAVNAGHRPVTITSIGFRFNIDHPAINPDKEPVFVTPAAFPDEQYLEKTLPVALSDGEALKVDFLCDTLLHLSSQTKGKFTAITATDAEGKQYSSPLPDSISKYLNYNLLDQGYRLLLETPPDKLEGK